MIKVENMKVFNLDGAIQGMRNPLKSRDKSDSSGDYIGEKDHELAMKLIHSGHDHSKFLRQILVSFDLTAPAYFWIQFDQYKVGVVTDSESTMHTIMQKRFTAEDFSADSLSDWMFKYMVDECNYLRTKYRKTQDPADWRALIQFLPRSYNQMRTVTANYEVLRNMYHARKNHKLTEWHDFCDAIEALPYSEFITG